MCFANTSHTSLHWPQHFHAVGAQSHGQWLRVVASFSSKERLSQLRPQLQMGMVLFSTACISLEQSPVCSPQHWAHLLPSCTLGTTGGKPSGAMCSLCVLVGGDRRVSEHGCQAGHSAQAPLCSTSTPEHEERGLTPPFLICPGSLCITVARGAPFCPSACWCRLRCFLTLLKGCICMCLGKERRWAF